MVAVLECSYTFDDLRCSVRKQKYTLCRYHNVDSTGVLPLARSSASDRILQSIWRSPSVHIAGEYILVLHADGEITGIIVGLRARSVWEAVMRQGFCVSSWSARREAAGA